MAIEFEVADNKQDTRPGGEKLANTRLIKVNFRPLPGSPIHSNIFHMQLYPTGTRRIVDSRGRLVTESGKPVPPIVGGILEGAFPDEDSRDPYQRETFTRNNDAEMTANVEAYWERKLKAVEEGKPYPQHHQSTLSFQVGASADDAHEKGSGASFDSTSGLWFLFSHTAGFDYNAGARFASVNIAGDATIDAAVLKVECVLASQDDIDLTIYGEDVDDADDFVTDADVTDRVSSRKTTASAAWQIDNEGLGEAISPDFKSAVQEIIDRAGWASGNAMVILLAGKTSVTKLFRGGSWDHSSAEAPKLDIDFTAGGAPATRRGNLPLTGVG